MTYQDTLTYLTEHLPMFQRLGTLAYQGGLENTFKLDEYFKSPHNQFRSIHVAGTNGKGSVSHMLASILQHAGYKVGLYTSPHLLDFRERIKVNGKMISKKFVIEFVKIHKPFFDSFHPSFFEISLYLAFQYFIHEKIDVAVMEVGLGGRLDSTNIITPVVSVITNIGLDHMEILGDTLEKIAGEKAGIIKNKVPVVIGESHNQTLPIFRKVASEKSSQLILADEVFKIDYSLTSVDGYQVFNVKRNNAVHYPNLKCELLGHYQRKNTVTVLATIDILKKKNFEIADLDIYSGIKKAASITGLSGRWQVISNSPLVICDTAHNSDGLALVMQQVVETPYTNLHIILGFVSDKDVSEILNHMPVKAFYYFTRLSVPRTMDEKKLMNLARKYDLKGDSYISVDKAYQQVIGKISKNDLVIITGSTFLVADFLAFKKLQLNN